VDKLNNLGLCVSYDRVQEIEATVTNWKCNIYNSLGHVVQIVCLKAFSQTTPINNIDHNPSSSTANEAFHGSSVTVIQHPDANFLFPEFRPSELSLSRKIDSSLPDSYTTLPVTGNVVCEPPLPNVNISPVMSDTNTFELLKPWLNVVQASISDMRLAQPAHISLSAFHAHTLSDTAISNDTLLPLLRNHVQSPATVRHLMNVIKHITTTVNGCQVAVITADQPVYAVAKYVQWKYPDLYGENKIVLMMGGLHIEMAVQNLIGKWLSGSGWSEMFLKADVATSGRCEAMLKSSYIKRTRYAHKVSLAALFIGRNEAYKTDCKDVVESLDVWVSRRCSIELEGMLLNFV